MYTFSSCRRHFFYGRLVVCVSVLWASAALVFVFFRNLCLLHILTASQPSAYHLADRHADRRRRWESPVCDLLAIDSQALVACPQHLDR